MFNSLCVFSLLAFASVGCSQDKAGSTTNSVAPVATNSAPAVSAAASFDDPTKLTAQAPETFRAKFETTKGAFTVEITRSLSPNGADRFYNLVRSGYFSDIAFFRVLPGFMVQFGIHGDPAVSAKWRGANISDDPVKTTNARGTITFATAGPGTRTTQLFINYADNAFLDGQGFSPFGKVVDGMDVVDKINSESGERPDQGEIQGEGNKYLKSAFPNLDYIKSATIVSDGK